MVLNMLWGAAFMGVAVLAAWRLVDASRRHDRHRRRTNKPFMAGYRAGYRAARCHHRRRPT